RGGYRDPGSGGAEDSRSEPEVSAGDHEGVREACADGEAGVERGGVSAGAGGRSLDGDRDDRGGGGALPGDEEAAGSDLGRRARGHQRGGDVAVGEHPWDAGGSVDRDGGAGAGIGGGEVPEARSGEYRDDR